MKNLREKKCIAAFFSVMFMLLCWPPIQASAADATVTFGSDSYTKENNEEFPVGVYISGEAQIGTYYVEVEYDTNRIQYLSGGDSEQDGIIILRGTGLRNEVKYMLYFRSLSGGEAGIRIRTASIQNTEEEGSADFTVTTLGTAPITISGEDETGISFFDSVAEETESNQEDATIEDFGIDTEMPILAAIDIGNGNRYYIVDHALYVPEDVQWIYRRTNGYYQKQPVTFLTSRIDQIAKECGAEYTDIYETGLNDNYLMEAGWLLVGADKNIIPNYFFPYTQCNVDIDFSTTDEKIILFKGDGDQDRPN